MKQEFDAKQLYCVDCHTPVPPNGGLIPCPGCGEETPCVSGAYLNGDSENAID